MADWAAVLPDIARQGVAVFPDASPRPVGGGDISNAWRIDGAGGPVFLKTGPADTADRFAAEMDGLTAIAASDSLRVPAVFGTGVTGPLAWLALEWLELEACTEAGDRELGRRLARMHRDAAEAYGWRRDNAIGSTRQVNTPSSCWAAFFTENRIAYQLETAARYGYAGELKPLGDELLAGLPILLAGHQPPASLLHGDLWSGNRALSDGAPVFLIPPSIEAIEKRILR